METTIETPPRTMMEVYKSLPEGTPAQLIKNNLVLLPSPLYKHQDIQAELIKSLFLFLHKNPLGKLLVAPLDVYLDDKNVFQPDIIFISNNHLKIIQKDGLHGAPDLVIEILSPSTAKYDLHQKKDVYERSGVKEYWIVDPDSKEAQGYFLQSGAYSDPLVLVGKIQLRMMDLELSF